MKSTKTYGKNYIPRKARLKGRAKNLAKQETRRKKRRIKQIEKELNCVGCPNPTECRDCAGLKEYTDVYFITDEKEVK